MKTFLITVVVILTLCRSASAVDRTKLDEFASDFGAALKAKDFHALNQFIYSKDVCPQEIDGVIGTWAEELKMYTFDGVTFHPLDDPSLNPRAIKPAIEGETTNGHRYGPNLKPEVLCIVTFKGEHGGGSGNTYVLGLAPDGSLKIAMQVPRK